MTKIRLTGYIVVPDDDLSNVEQALPTHIELTRQEAGCLLFTVTQAADNPNRFEVYEEFSSRAAFDNHQQRVRESAWGKVAANVQRHYQISEI